MIHICAKNQASQRGLCISGVSVLQKVTLKNFCLSDKTPVFVSLNLWCKPSCCLWNADSKEANATYFASNYIFTEEEIVVWEVDLIKCCIFGLIKVCSINFEPPDNDLCSACHFYLLSREAWMISILIILNRFTWGVEFEYFKPVDFRVKEAEKWHFFWSVSPTG